MKFELTRRELFCGLADPFRPDIQNFITKCSEFLNKKYSIEIESSCVSEEVLKAIREKFRRLHVKALKKYNDVARNKDRFLVNEDNWLNQLVLSEEFSVFSLIFPITAVRAHPKTVTRREKRPGNT